MHPRAAELIALLSLEVHPEGGRYRRVYTSAQTLSKDGATRPVVTAIHYLLCAGEISRWHCIDADEIWLHHEGSAIELLLYDAASGRLERRRLGRSDASSGTQAMIGVAAGCWQAARALGDYALVSCSVAPGFEFAGFSLLDASPRVAAQLKAIDPALLALA